ncbi:MAG: hypothetical protein JST30_12495 [Armatimonadetes bacterium]|nr:hypothetical protein [Armatimonadota bacterium]
MSHTRKKGGQRKDKKVERMHEAEEYRRSMSDGPKPTTDQKDIVGYKSGGPSDRNREPRPTQPERR